MPKSTCVYAHPAKRVLIALQKYFVQGLEYTPNMLLVTEVTAPKIQVRCQRTEAEILDHDICTSFDQDDFPDMHEMQNLFESGHLFMGQCFFE